MKDHGGNVLGGVGLAVDVDFACAAHIPLDGDNGAVRVGDGLAFCHLAYQPLPVLGKGYHRRRGAGAFGIGDNNGFAALHDRYAAIGGTQIDTDDLSHKSVLLFLLGPPPAAKELSF
ncbi:hypothetical protein SDC9_212092 [bioreactor metagenome]|uniref:Uncharacterized protein n=1 Tax=bioreactor metagenome TaxID=1076179 RepID=A0A645JMK4_9ZZZZ